MDVMYDLKLKVDGDASSPSLSFKDVIFVIEDVDAASKVVLRRDANGKDAKAFPADEMKALASTMSSGFATKPRATVSEDDTAGCSPDKTMAQMMEDLVRPPADQLNLAGLLNVLDGVVDTPGRLLILTSNHPEKLDPALIRPGRVDRLIHLGYLRPAEAAQMISHYFRTQLNTYQLRRLDLVFQRAECMTPAMLEQLCARHQTIDALLAELEQAGLREPCQNGQDPHIPAKMTVGRQLSGG